MIRQAIAWGITSETSTCLVDDKDNVNNFDEN